MSSTASRSTQPTAPVAGADSSRARAGSASQPAPRIGVLLVEDHAVVRTALRLVIERQYDMQVVGEAGSGEQAITQARALKPDVVVMDVLLPGMDGAEATEQICRALPETRVVALTMCEEESYAFPQNVQELEEILRFAVAFRQATWAERFGDRSDRRESLLHALDLQDLPPEVQTALPPGSPEPVPPAPMAHRDSHPAEPVPEQAEEKDQLLTALEANGWHLTRTAEHLGINRTTLWRRMKRVGIQRPSGRG